MGTPNGQKITIMLEELLAAGYKGAEYDAFYINIFSGDQFGSGFVDVNPNSKIPALLDTTTNPHTKMFESGSILLQLSEKFDNFACPPQKRAEVLNWLFWQMGSAPVSRSFLFVTCSSWCTKTSLIASLQYLGGGFGHFYAYAPYKMKYPIDRFTMEVKRQLDVLEKHLAKRGTKYMLGDDITLADIAIHPWYGHLVLGKGYDNAEIFLNAVEEYPHVIKWAKEMESRPAVKRGNIVNKKAYVKERHSASDFDKFLDEEEEKIQKKRMNSDDSNNQPKEKQSKL